MEIELKTQRCNDKSEKEKGLFSRLLSWFIIKKDRFFLFYREGIDFKHIQSSSRSIQGGEWTNPVDCIKSKLLLWPGRAEDEAEELELLPVVLLVLLLKLTTPENTQKL